MTVTIAETRDIAACRALRRTVFIEEQGVSEAEEIDDRDDAAIHLLATDGGQHVGTARLILSGTTGKIGRVCVLPSHRGAGLGSALIRFAVARLQRTPGIEVAKLGAQIQAIEFYRKLGFSATGPVYDDAGIPHRDMVRGL